MDWNDETKTVEICQPFSYQEVMKAQDVIKTFFDDFAENNYTEMKKVLSEPFSQYDISNGVYGMNASNNNGNNKGACYILVHKDRDTYTISNFVSGL